MSLTSGKPVIIGTLGVVPNITVESIAKLKKMARKPRKKDAVRGSAKTAQHVLRLSRSGELAVAAIIVTHKVKKVF